MTATEFTTLHPVRRYAADKPTSLVEEWREIFRSGHLLWNLIHRDLTVRYKRSVLGFFWTMLHPLLLIVILMLVFSEVFRFAVKGYEVYVLSALLPWTFFSQTTVGSMASWAWNGQLMKRVRVPKSIFVFSGLLAGLVNLMLSYIPLVAIMLIRGTPIRPALAFLPVSIFILAVFTYGVSLMLSALAVYFVDVREMYAVALTALMYLTPIIYPMEIIPARYRTFVEMNPLLYFIEIVRAPVYAGTLPSMNALAIASAAAAIVLLAGWAIFRRLSRGFYPYL